MRYHLYKEEMECLIKLGLTPPKNTMFCYYTVVEYEYIGNRTIKKDEYGGFDFYIDDNPSSFEHYDNDYGCNEITSITQVYSVTEMIELLPRIIRDDNNTEYKLHSDLHGVWYESADGSIAYSNRCSELIDSLYNILIYLLTNPNHYIYEQIGK